ncbi:MAG: D-alanyl-D-alanine carboxypeptidase [Defluviitaleaceae bacterium]|nr:D-alanyl-D-alanine carboxypeptidase [Defluviitaleaceae bacterium]
MKKLFVLFAVFILCGNAYAQEHAPEVAAHGAVLMDAETGRVLWGKNEHTPLAMASTTKIMTAILALESGREDEIVKISARAAAAPKVKMFLSTGEEVRLKDLMLALMLESSNDAAVAIAEHLSGTVEAFCRQMTEKARQIGALNTIFETPNGLDSGEHHSTAYDLAAITRYALQVPGFIALTNTPNASFSSNRREYAFTNRNRLLHEFTGANGVKTGFTNKAGHCFVGAALRDDMQLISVVLGSGWGERGKQQKWVDTKSILNHGFDNFEFVTVITADTLAGTMPITRSRTASVDFAYNKTLRIPMDENDKKNLYAEVSVPDSTKAPVKKGDTLGTVKIFIGTDFYSEVLLSALSSAERHDFKTSLEKILNEYFGQITEKQVEVVLPEF